MTIPSALFAVVRVTALIVWGVVVAVVAFLTVGAAVALVESLFSDGD